MSCEICKALKREHGRECEIEAIAILESKSATSEAAEQLDATVIRSRKRQSEITTRIEKHKAAAHAASA